MATPAAGATANISKNTALKDPEILLINKKVGMDAT